MTIDNCLEDRIISYFDIIGFKNKIKRIEDEPKLCEVINKTFDNIKKMQEDRRKQFKEKFEEAFFSDSLVISNIRDNNKDGGSEEFIIFATHSIASDLICDGFFVRGGIARGKCHHDANNLFGEGYLKAYDLEKKDRVPRIIIDKDIVESLENYKNQKRFYLKHDLDYDIWYINLFKIGNPDDPPSEDTLTYKLCHIKEHICSEFEKSEKSCDNKDKYRWLTTEFNISLDEYKNDGYTLSGIDKIDLDKIC